MTYTTYGDVLKPASIGAMRLKNRICMAPMDFEFFTCASQAELAVMPYPHDMQFLTIHPDERVKDFAEAADMVHVWGAKIGCELTMGSGRYVDTPVPGADPIAPSDCQAQYDPRIHARAMTRDEIAHMVRTFPAAVGSLKTAGFDYVLVMGQSGYLINQL